MSGGEIVALAGAVSAAVSQCMDNEELGAFCELLGLTKHNLEVIKCRRFIADKKEDNQKKS